jgi:hypothetical protein
MEPRPPRPRSSHPFETPGSPETAGIGERLYPAPGEPAYYPGAETYAPGAPAAPPLLPRRQRRQRGALRGIAVAVVLIAAVAGLGWVFRDAVSGLIAPPAPSPAAEALVTAPGTPTAAPESVALPNALATVTPTVEPRVTPSPEPDEDAPADAVEATEPAAPDRDISAQTLPLLDLLPSQEQMPAGLILVDEAERSKEEVIAALGSTEQAAQLLDDWGWSGNAFRDFIADEDAPPPSGTTFLNVSVHRFADAESAANALIVFSDEVILSQGLQEVEPPALGESARLLVGEANDVTLSVLYAQQGPIMYRIGGSAAIGSGDPTVDVLAVAGEIVPGQGEGG